MKVSYLQKFKHFKSNQNSIQNLNNHVLFKSNIKNHQDEGKQSIRNQTSKSDSVLLNNENAIILPQNLMQPLSAPNNRIVKIVPSTSQYINPIVPAIIINSSHTNDRNVKVAPKMTPKFIKIVGKQNNQYPTQSVISKPNIRKPSPKLMMINRENPVIDKEQEIIPSKIDPLHNQIENTIIEEITETDRPKISKIKSSEIENDIIEYPKPTAIIVKRSEKIDDTIQPIDLTKKLWYAKSQLDLKKESSEELLLLKNRSENVKKNLILLQFYL